MCCYSPRAPEQASTELFHDNPRRKDEVSMIVFNEHEMNLCDEFDIPITLWTDNYKVSSKYLFGLYPTSDRGTPSL